ncbi:ead/Ea22-like family protein [Escherichia coli]|nr:ead/Ea22-like family protein [Escherichia coli]
MSKIDYQALREKAEKATSGVWSLEYGEERFDAGDALIHREVVGYLPICRIEGAHPESGFDEDFQMEQQANAEFIAAASPDTVLALLDELEDAERQILKLERLAEAESVGADKAAESCVEWMKRCHAAEKRIAELEAEPVSQTCKLNDPSGNSPVTPDGWISCSERMPENIPGSCKEYLVFDGLNNKVHHDYWVVPDGDSAPVASFWNHYGAHVTHWMPLPEPPQEVK